MPRIRDRLLGAWNVFTAQDKSPPSWEDGVSYSYRPDRIRLNVQNERTIMASITTRIALDVAATNIRHVQTDQNGRFSFEIPGPLNELLAVEANIDQSSRSMIQDLISTLIDEGTCALVPVYTSDDPNETGSYDVYNVRVGKILEWKPQKIVVDLYDERDSTHKRVKVLKTDAAIFENPFYSVMNEPNSTLKRLSRKLNLLDAVDEATSSGKLDIIVQLPFVVKSQTRMKQAEQRTKDIEMQLKGSKYGIAYIDGTEKVIQLNRPAENNLLTQITYLTNSVYTQVGLTAAVVEGTASEQEMLNYYNRTIEPFVSAIVDEFQRKFLTKNARGRGQAFKAFKDPFKFVSMEKFAEMADKFTRNEIMSSNEIRAVIGLPPDSDPKSDRLVNSNLNQPTDVNQSIADASKVDEKENPKEQEVDSSLESQWRELFD